MTIDKVVVIGAGTMGGGIAAHCANAGASVVLLDLADSGADRNSPAKDGLQRINSSEPAALMSRRFAQRIEVGNIEDDLHRVGEADWVIEAVVENLRIKTDLYERIEGHRGERTIVSSNTSTIPLSQLVAGRSDAFRRHFAITHFFNPPRYMHLLELISGLDTDSDVLERLSAFCDVALGKGVVRCYDTPGFIANRIGSYWFQRALQGVLEHGIDVETADALLSRPFGIPKTGVFGLLDLVGLDLIEPVRQSLRSTLPEGDPLTQTDELPSTLVGLIAEGYTGRKGKGGFYRLNRSSGTGVKEVLNLDSGTYTSARRPRAPRVSPGAEGELRRFLESDDRGARFAFEVMRDVLGYAARVLPEVADDVASVDAAMRWGYGWAYGPFELIDQLGVEWFVERLRSDGLVVPPVLESSGGLCYRRDAKTTQALSGDGAMVPVVARAGAERLANRKRGNSPLLRNGSASLWDIGDRVLCLEFHSKMNALDQGTLEIAHGAIRTVGEGGFAGLVIYNDDENFSVGANAGIILFAANTAAWELIEHGLKGGQDVLQALRAAPFPVVGAPGGMALGGGCEFLLHCDAIQAHAETYMGLVEVGVGLVPGWGGCAELLSRWVAFEKRPHGPMPPVQKAFETISLAKVSRSAAEAQEMRFLRPDDRITMNRDRLLADARARVLELADGYSPPPPRPALPLPGPSGRAALQLAIHGFQLAGHASAHDAVVADALARILTGGETDITTPVEHATLLELEREAFLGLVRSQASAQRLEHMLETGRPLRN